jgi:hypothetical protein
MAEFKPAQTLYESFGFVYCGPFGSYKDDPYSVFMTLELGAGVTVSVTDNADDAVVARREPKP